MAHAYTCARSQGSLVFAIGPSNLVLNFGHASSKILTCYFCAMAIQSIGCVYLFKSPGKYFQNCLQNVSDFGYIFRIF